eukprot:4428172-Amphidinium_carterae.1
MTSCRCLHLVAWTSNSFTLSLFRRDGSSGNPSLLRRRGVPRGPVAAAATAVARWARHWACHCGWVGYSRSHVLDQFRPEQLKKWAGALNTDKTNARNDMAANACWFINSCGRAGNDAKTFAKCFMNDEG